VNLRSSIAICSRNFELSPAAANTPWTNIGPCSASSAFRPERAVLSPVGADVGHGEDVRRKQNSIKSGQE